MDVSGTIKIGDNGDIGYNNGKLQFKNDKSSNWIDFGTSTASTIASTPPSSAILNLLVSNSPIDIFNTPTNVSVEEFVYNTNIKLLLSKSPDILMNLLTTLKPDDTISTFIKNLPVQLLVPGPTDLSYNTSDKKLNWKYDGGTKYPVSGFYLHGGLDKPSTVKILTNSDLTYTLDTDPVPGTVYYLHGITSVYGNSLRFSKIII